MQEMLANPAVQGGLAPFIAALIVAALLAPFRLGGLAVVTAFATAVYFIAGFDFAPLTATRKIILLGFAAPLANRPVWLHSAERFLARDDVKQFILVISPADREYFHFKFGANVAIHGIDVLDGGANRAESVAKALAHVKPDIEYICVHDAARPCVRSELIEQFLDELEDDQVGGLLAIPLADTL